MLKKLVFTSLLATVFLAGGSAYADVSAPDPSVQQIYAAAESGHLSLAQTMIAQVLRDHPDSARAHYVAAELFARANNLPNARQQFQQAEALDPGLSFAKPASVQALQKQLTATSSYPTGVLPRHSSVPWGFIGLIVAVAVVWVMFRRRAAKPAYQSYSGTGPASAAPSAMPPVVPPYAGPPYGAGSGLMGNIASGLAVGAGVAAGEELVRHAFGSNGVISSANAGEYGQETNPPNPDMGGNDFGVSDPGSSWDDSSSGGDSFGVDLSGGDGWS